MFLFLLFGFANGQKMTIILVRHAEKDTSPTADKKNPDLTEAGKQRAEKLLQTVKKYQPQEINSTNLTRTRATVTPLAVNLHDKYRLQIQIYDPSELEKFAEKLLASNYTSIVVVGHSNTTPTLANLLIKENKYKDLPDSEYGKIWIVEIKKKKKKPNKIREKVIDY